MIKAPSGELPMTGNTSKLILDGEAEEDLARPLAMSSIISRIKGFPTVG
jgi:hypothetical protein